MRKHQPVKVIPQAKCLSKDSMIPLFIAKLHTNSLVTFSETRLLLPFNSSGAIHGSVPRTPPETRVLRLILDNPKSPT